MTSKNSKSSPFVALDIGTTTIKVLIAQRTSEGWDILGYGSHPAEGIKKSSIIHLEKAAASVRHALEEAELMAGVRSHNLITNISGTHVQSLNSHGIVPIKTGHVTRYDVNKVLEAAQALAIHTDQKILHVLPQSYTIDHHDGIFDPLHMSGIRLEVRCHLVTASINAISNILKVVSDCGMQAQDITLDSLACGYGVLSQDEKDLGVALIDIGGGTSKVSLFSKGAPIFSFVLPLAGDQITSDIALTLRTPIHIAETLKMRHGAAMVPSILQTVSDQVIQVPLIGGRESASVQRQELIEIISPRVEEIFHLIHKELVSKDLINLIPAGIVLTGGSAKLENITSVAQHIFKLPIRIGLPPAMMNANDMLDSPISATINGLLEWSYQRFQWQQSTTQDKWKQYWQKITYWLAN